MGTTAQATEAMVGVRREGIGQWMDITLRRFNLLERSATVKRLVELGIRGVEVEPIPPCLGESERAVLVSNYPAVYPTLRALIKVGARFPGRGYRLKGIGRPEVIAEANTILKVLGVDSVIFPVYKDEAGAYRMQKKVIQDVVAYLRGGGNVLWLSITGATRGNGLLEGDLRTGAALFATGNGVPMVPMGLVTREHKGRLRVVKVRFGEPIYPPPVRELGDFERTDFLIDLSRLALCHVARLLPPGQRGDFEQVEEKLQEAESRLGMGQE
jgi:hypothetical protein